MSPHSRRPPRGEPSSGALPGEGDAPASVSEEQLTGGGGPLEKTSFGSSVSAVDEDTRAAAGLLGAHVDRLRGRQDGSLEITPPRPRQTEHLETRRAHRPFLRRLTIFIAVAVAAVAIIHAFVVEPFTVPGNAMAPTLRMGDRILALKSGLLEGSIHSGDIVLFRAPHDLRCTVSGDHSGDLVLRVVATPGQVIASKSDTVLVNGRPLTERGWYDRSYGPIGSTPIRTTKLGLNQYFVMADDRLDGCDSRAFGPIDGSSIIGKAFAVVARNGHLSVGGV